MAKYKALAIVTKYWRPREGYLEEIIKSIEGKVADRDFVVVSEKAISTASGNVIDESLIMQSLSARLIAKFWMRTVWGCFLGPISHLGRKMIQSLREYPLDVGSRHKQVALWQAGLIQALMFGSEGGIDGSNLAYSYVSLPLSNAPGLAEEIRHEILSQLGKRVVVMISDTDRTYSFRNFHFSPRPKPLEGIHSCGGFAAYVIGRMLRLKRRATPIAVAGVHSPVESALEVAEIANRVRGSGAGRTVWDMADRFGVGLASVSWEMLETVKHKPIVIVRSRR
jgi:F420-0:gamma-glutamyl ligase-like protein